MFENEELNGSEYISSEDVKLNSIQAEAMKNAENVDSDITPATFEADAVQETEHSMVQDAVEDVVESVKEEQEEMVDTMTESVEPEVNVSPERNFYGGFQSYKTEIEQDAPVTGDKPKKTGAFGKVAKFVGMAAAFGLIAGSVFYGVNYAADQMFGTEVVSPEDVIKETTGIVVNKTENTTNQSQLMIMDVSHVVEEAMPSAVAITGTMVQNYTLNPFWGGIYETEAPVSGSGIIIGQNGTELLIVTNAHVVENVNNIKVSFIDGTTADAVVKGTKPNKDLAVIAVRLDGLSKDTLSNIAIIEIGDSDEVKMGQPVIAIGNALGEGQSSTVGWISALNRTIVVEGKEYENLIMTDAAINPGNSGGALLNTEGQLIGINSAKYADEDVEGMGYAIPISSVADIINDLMNKEVRTKVPADKVGYLGISGIDIDQSISNTYNWPVGALITQLGEGGPAEAAGLLKSDVIIGFDGEEITSFEQLRELMEYYAEGEVVKVNFYRLENGEYVEKSVEVTLGNRSANE